MFIVPLILASYTPLLTKPHLQVLCYLPGRQWDAFGEVVWSTPTPETVLTEMPAWTTTRKTSSHSGALRKNPFTPTSKDKVLLWCLKHGTIIHPLLQSFLTLPTWSIHSQELQIHFPRVQVACFIFYWRGMATFLNTIWVGLYQYQCILSQTLMLIIEQMLILIDTLIICHYLHQHRYLSTSDFCTKLDDNMH